MKLSINKHPQIFIIPLIVFIIFFISFFQLLRDYELPFYDLLFKIRPPLKTSSDLVFIEISDDTLENLGQWPLPRDFHASLIDILSEFQIKMIIFDVFFNEPSIYDGIFSNSIKQAGNVYIPEVLDISETAQRNYVLPKAKRILAGARLFKEVSNFGGHINTFVDSDGKIRRIPLFIEYKSKLIPQLALNTACRFLGLNIENVKIQKRRVIIDDKLQLPVSFNNSFLVNFPSKWGSAFRHLSYFQILKSYKDLKEGRTPAIDLTSLKNKVCFIGLTATGTSDVRANPLQSSYPLLGLQASVFNSIIQHKFIREIPPLFSALISLLLFFISFYLSMKFKPIKAFIAILGLILFYLLIAVFAFIFKGLWLDNIFLGIFIISGVYITTRMYKFLEELRQRQILERELHIARDIQRSFLPKDIPEFNFAKLACFMQPAKFVSGDLYDLILLDKEHLGVFIADVSGKGVSASLIMAQTVSLFRVFAKDTTNPAQTLSKLNNELCKILEGRFVTALYLIINSQSHNVSVSCAGHNPLIFYSSLENRISEILPCSAPPLGIMGGLEYDSFEVNINTGDKVLLYTDGLSEARNKKQEEFGMQRIKDLLFSNRQLPAKLILDNLKTAGFKFQRGLSQYDDITLILLEF